MVPSAQSSPCFARFRCWLGGPQEALSWPPTDAHSERLPSPSILASAAPLPGDFEFVILGVRRQGPRCWARCLQGHVARQVPAWCPRWTASGDGQAAGVRGRATGDWLEHGVARLPGPTQAAECGLDRPSPCWEVSKLAPPEMVRQANCDVWWCAHPSSVSSRLPPRAAGLAVVLWPDFVAARSARRGFGAVGATLVCSSIVLSVARSFIPLARRVFPPARTAGGFQDSSVSQDLARHDAHL